MLGIKCYIIFTQFIHLLTSQWSHPKGLIHNSGVHCSTEPIYKPNRDTVQLCTSIPWTRSSCL